MGSKGIALGTVDTTLDSSSWFVGRPDIGNGCAETRGYHNSTQEIHCIPIKHRGNLCFEHNTSEVRVPQSTAFAFTNDWLSYIFALHSGFFRLQKPWYVFCVPVADNCRSFGK